MAYSVDWVAKEVTIPVSDLTLVSGSEYDLDLTDFHAEIRRLEYDFAEGFGWEQILDHTNPKLGFAGADYAAFDEIINDYTIQFAAGPTRVNLNGSNNNILDVLVPTGVAVASFNSAGKQLINTGSGLTVPQSDQLERIHGQVERGIWIDTEAAINGNGYQQSPFNSLTDAIDEAESLGIHVLYVWADIVIDRQLKNFKIIGIGEPTVDVNGQNLEKSEFLHCKMEGNYSGVIVVQESTLLNGFWLNGTFERNSLGGDLFCVDGAKVLLTQNVSAIAGLGRPTISMNATGTCKLSVRKNGGGLTIKDCNQVTDEVTAEVSEGSLTFDASNNDGVMVARGACTFVDLATAAGATVYDEVLHPDHAHKVYEAHFNRRKHDLAANTITIFSADNITPLHVFDADDALTDITPQ